MNIPTLYIIKCDDLTELFELKNIGQEGLPYVPKWTKKELNAQNKFPMYVQVKPINNDLLLLDYTTDITYYMNSNFPVLVIPLKELAKQKSQNNPLKGITSYALYQRLNQINDELNDWHISGHKVKCITLEKNQIIKELKERGFNT